METKDKRKLGKKNRASGADFERRVRKDLEEKGWIVDKWSNNVLEGKLSPARHKFRGVGIPMAIGTGFPDFIAFQVEKEFKSGLLNGMISYNLIGVECKTNGYLDKSEKEKCKWLIDNHIFSKILIASKHKIKNRIHIEYNEFKAAPREKSATH